jgi:hypothetical protein
MPPKSKCQVYVSFDDSAGAVKYYNPETCKVLISHNFCNITPPNNPTPPEPIKLTPHIPHVGETGGSMPPMGVMGSDDKSHNLEFKWKQKRNEIEEDVDIDAPWKMHGIHIDFKNLHDPITEEEEENFLSMEEAFAIIAGDELIVFESLVA